MIMQMRFRLGGIDIELSFWFFAAVAIFATFSDDILAFYFIIPVIIHETGHLIAMAAGRTKIESIRFTAFGIDIQKRREQFPALGGELAVSFAGPLANLIAAAAIYFFAFESMRSMLMISANIAIAAFNLLPIGNLDGGEIARKISEYYFKPRTALMLSRIFSLIALTPLFAAAIFLILLPQRNFSLLLICVYLLADVIANT